MITLESFCSNLHYIFIRPGGGAPLKSIESKIAM